MFYQIFFSPQVKRSVIISNKHGTYELPHKFPNDLRLRILGNQEVSRRSQRIFIQLQPSAQSSSQNDNFVDTRRKSVQKLKLNFSRSELFHANTKVCLIYFGQDCLWKKCFVSNSSQSLSNLICFTILVTLRPLTQFSFKIRVTNLQRSDKICFTL